MSDSDASWDAGTLGCGELLMELRFKIAELQSKQVFKVICRDPGAPEEMPSWCRLTGHKLLKQEHPSYWIEKK
ncbi:MAG: sulfurtransferase TusA family protein [Candidatus Obscuribacterales bacterium]|nr:sulfurtransferase TusA family protein [Candidatus Obscuribacterales bacterium]